jgi:hypothetical protein
LYKSEIKAAVKLIFKIISTTIDYESPGKAENSIHNSILAEKFNFRLYYTT